MSNPSEAGHTGLLGRDAAAAPIPTAGWMPWGESTIPDEVYSSPKPLNVRIALCQPLEAQHLRTGGRGCRAECCEAASPGLTRTAQRLCGTKLFPPITPGRKLHS